eukprot:COSAG02_NODE_22936_length_735_cov_1.218553_1_plen_22_part_10
MVASARALQRVDGLLCVQGIVS